MPKRGNNRGVWEGETQDQVSRLTEHNKSSVDGDTSKSLKGFTFHGRLSQVCLDIKLLKIMQNDVEK